MNSEIAIIAALPREVSGLVGGLQPDRRLRKGGIWLYRLPRAVVVAAGMGPGRAALAVEASLAEAGIKQLFSVGLAGACSAELAPGSVAEAKTVIDTQTGERYETGAEGGVTLATTAAIASMSEKARLAAAYGAAMVDMEAATVARLARAHGLGFRAIKGISDAHDFEIESLARFADERGQFRTGAFALHVALRPVLWSKAAALGRNSSHALAALTATVRSVLEES